MRKKIEKRGILVMLVVMILSIVQPLIAIAQETLAEEASKLSITIDKKEVAIGESVTVTSAGSLADGTEKLVVTGEAGGLEIGEKIDGNFTLTAVKAGNYTIHTEASEKTGNETEEATTQKYKSNEIEVVVKKIVAEDTDDKEEIPSNGGTDAIVPGLSLKASGTSIDVGAEVSLSFSANPAITGEKWSYIVRDSNQDVVLKISGKPGAYGNATKDEHNLDIISGTFENWEMEAGFLGTTSGNLGGFSFKKAGTYTAVFENESGEKSSDVLTLTVKDVKEVFEPEVSTGENKTSITPGDTITLIQVQGSNPVESILVVEKLVNNEYVPVYKVDHNKKIIDGYSGMEDFAKIDVQGFEAWGWRVNLVGKELGKYRFYYVLKDNQGIASGKLEFEVSEFATVTVPELQGLEYLGNIIDYNLFVDGEHSANSADIEGASAITGNSKLPKDYTTFSYGASFEPGRLNTVGLPIIEEEDRQYVNTLIGGKVVNYRNPEEQNRVVPMASYKVNTIDLSAPRDKRGWLVGVHTEDANSIGKWLPEAFGKNYSAVPYQISRDAMDAQLNKLRSERDSLQNLLANAAAFGIDNDEGYVPTDGKEYTALSDNQKLKLYTTNLKGVLAIDIDALMNEGMIERLTLPIEVLRDENVKQIVVYSKQQQKIVFNGDTSVSIDGEPQQTEGFVTTGKTQPESINLLTQKLAYVFPAATQITNYLKNDTHPNNIQTEGVNEKGEDLYGELKTDNQKANGITATTARVLGSVIAPNATVVFQSGNINGYVFVKNLHHRNGMEVHNFRNDYVFDLIERRKVSLLKTDDKGQPLSNAEFTLCKKNQSGKYDPVENYVYRTGSDGEVMMTEKEIAALYAADNAGEYLFRETAPPPGYQIGNNPDTPTFKITKDKVVGADGNEVTELTLGTIQNQPLDIIKKSVEFRKVSSTDIAEKPLAGATFELWANVNNTWEKVIDAVLPGISQKLSDLSTNGTVTFEDGFLNKFVPSQQYYLKEVSAPKGYKNNDVQNLNAPTIDEQSLIKTRSFKVTSKGILVGESTLPAVILKVKRKNTPIRATVKINKVDADQLDLKLPNAVFELYKEGSQTPIHTTPTANIGEITIADLEPGKYYLEEKTPPDGYKLDKSKINFEISAEGILVFDSTQYPNVIKESGDSLIIQIKNSKEYKGSLPMTGGNGIQMFVAIGLLIVLATIGCAVKSKLSEDNSGEGGM